MKKLIDKIQEMDNGILGCIVMVSAMTASYILGVSYGKRIK